MKQIVILILFSLLAGCELESRDKSDRDYTAEYLNNRCDLSGEFRYYPTEGGGYCMRCEFNTWRAVDCSDFPACGK